MPIKIAIAEDNNLLAQALQEKLSFFDNLNYKFRGVNGKELIDLLEKDHNIDIVLMDIQMPEMDGITATEIIKKKHPQIKIIMITVFDDDENIFNAIKAGADGYLLKDSNTEEIHSGILNVMKGGAAMTPTIALRTLEFLRYPEKFTADKILLDEVKLTKRETEILTQLSKGLNYNQIAENLFISPSTVRKHIENTYKKLQVHNKMEAVQEGMKRNLI
ncbi:MAG TPA: response regulator transcription factor [Crocinitomicaceae bacterium]|nr:response regulator transcription factor [Crocinitomicaceae bacterium]